MRFFYLLLGVGALLMLLHGLFPDAVLPQDVHMHILYSVILLVLVGSGMTLQRTHTKENVRNAGIWLAMIAGLALAYQLLANLGGSDSVGGNYF
jgi:asparagine N-glycosylation enzyme membrane subunit Stt3